MLGWVEAHLVSRHDLADWPVIGKIATRCGTLYVDRSSVQSGARLLKVMTQALQTGRAVAIYPEGTAHPGHRVRSFRSGAFQAAVRADTELVPMGIAYNDPVAYYGRESFALHLRRVAQTTGLVASVSVGEPIAAEGDVIALRRRSKEIVQQLVDDARTRL